MLEISVNHNRTVTVVILSQFVSVKHFSVESANLCVAEDSSETNSRNISLTPAKYSVQALLVSKESTPGSRCQPPPSQPAETLLPGPLPHKGDTGQRMG